MVALIPARAGSKRIPRKNTKLLAGHPLIAYTIAAAQQSGVFDQVFVCTETEWTAEFARLFGAEVLYRSDVSASDDAPDLVWVKEALACVECDAFAILRPTSPFRSADTIRRAWLQFLRLGREWSSLRAVEPVRQTPFKMWVRTTRPHHIVPLLNVSSKETRTPYHSLPTQMAPTVFIQNSSLEMAWTTTVSDHHSITGPMVAPFFTEGYEGFAIDTPEDWERAEQIAAAHPELLPRIEAHAS